jgi:hypothetical protein
VKFARKSFLRSVLVSFSLAAVFFCLSFTFSGPSAEVAEAVMYQNPSTLPNYTGPQTDVTGKPTGGTVTNGSTGNDADKPPSWWKDPAGAIKAGIADALKNIGHYLIKYIGFFFLVLGILIQWVANAFLYIAAWALEGSIQMLVRDMGSYDALWDAVKEGWEAIRDVGNTLFIFVLLYAAFNTVLGLKNGLDLVPRIIVVALLVNFSFLFATSVIDVSNEFASTVATELTGAKGGDFTGKLASLAGYTSLKNALSWDSLKTSINNAYTTATASNDTGNSVFSGFAEFIKLTFSSSFIFILGGFMLAVCLTLVARFVTLVVLCVVSALAFLAYLLPRFENHSREWWTTLIGQSFYAPAVLLMLLITTGIAEKSKSSIKSTMGSGVDGNLKGLFSFGLAEFFQFCVLIGLLYASMSLARKLSEAGSKAALSIGQRAQKVAAAAAFGGAGFGLRHSLGRLGGWASDNEWLKKQSVKGGLWGAANRRLMGVAGRAQDSSFDFRGTGAAAALSAATGSDYGQAGGAKGWKGIADAREKKLQERIDAVKAMDISGDDKKDAVEKIASASNSKYSEWKRNAESYSQQRSNFETKIKELEAAAKDKPGDKKIQADLAHYKDRLSTLKSSESYNSAKIKSVEDAAWAQFNKQKFGVATTSRDINYSERFARSLASDAAKRTQVGRLAKMVGVGIGGTMLAPVAGMGAAAVGVLAGGRAVHNIVYKASGRKDAEHKIAQKYVKKYEEIEKTRREIDVLEAKSTLNDREKGELKKKKDKVEKFENQGKKKDS